MASNTNVVVLSGRLTADAELRGNDDNPIVGFRLAVNQRVKQGEEWGEKAHFFDVTMFRSGGLAPHLTKGKSVLIHGRLDFRQWETEDGKRSAVSVVANDLEFTGTKAQATEAPAAAAEPDWVNE